jgi:3-phenylpropionate/trans-cinnamate dioxygenase ferredoxin reductase subunit
LDAAESGLADALEEVMPQNVLIVGAGQAGAQAAAALRSEGFAGTITLVGGETHLPYQRPSLSKALLLGKHDADATIWRPASFYEEQRIALRLGTPVCELDRAAQTIRLADGDVLAYDRLVLATGTRPRRLGVPGADRPELHYLRTLADAALLKGALLPGRRAVVIGGGFIGLEVAATARQLGVSVTVVEAQSRLMARSVARGTSDTFRRLHESRGVAVQLETGVEAIEAGNPIKVATHRGRLGCDLALVGIGAVAHDEIAAAAGLETANGIVVDAMGRTADPAIFAIGDCAVVADPASGRHLRLESVQNAVDQGRAIAALILGRPAAANPIPWFWSDQYDTKLQIAGVARGETGTEIVRGDEARNAFSVFRYTGQTLVAVDSINAPGDHIVARRLLASGLSPDPATLSNPSLDLRSLVVAGRPA